MSNRFYKTTNDGKTTEITMDEYLEEQSLFLSCKDPKEFETDYLSVTGMYEDGDELYWRCDVLFIATKENSPEIGFYKFPSSSEDLSPEIKR